MWVALGLCAVLVGCDKPQPSVDALMMYFKEAALGTHGRVRMLWPAGQQYANTVLKHYVALKDSLAEIDDAIEDRLDPADPRWQDEELVAKRQKAVEDLVKKRDERAEQLKALLTSIDELPSGLPLNEEGLIERLRDALGVGPDMLVTPEAELDLLASYYTAMPADPAQGRELAGQLRASVEKQREMFLSYAAERLPKIVDQAAKLDARKDRHESEYLSDEKKALTAQLEAIPKQLKLKLDALEAERKRLESDKVKVANKEQRIAFLNERRDALQQERAAMQGRIEEILASADRPE